MPNDTSVTRHTSPPWVVQFRAGALREIVADQRDLATVWPESRSPAAAAEANANAELMAAAPELLEEARRTDAAFTWLAEQMNSITDNAKHWNVSQIEALAQDLRIGIERNQKRTRAAIAKAEGRAVHGETLPDGFRAADAHLGARDE